MRTFNKSKWHQYAGVCVLAFLAIALQGCGVTTGTSSRIAFGSSVSAPAGLASFCAQQADRCGAVEDITVDTDVVATGGQGYEEEFAEEQAFPEQENEAGALPSRVEVSISNLPEIARVNREVNDRVEWATDLELYGVEERWTLPQRHGDRLAGDCEDYALEKRRLLIDAGIPPAALAFATAYSPSTGHHAVLIVRTNLGDFVLDSATSWVLPWRETAYTWQDIQEGSDLLHWRDIVS